MEHPGRGSGSKIGFNSALCLGMEAKFLKNRMSGFLKGQKPEYNAENRILGAKNRVLYEKTVFQIVQ